MDDLSPIMNAEQQVLSAKRGHAKIVDDELKVEVPDGWKRQVVQRQGGVSAGKYDVYYFSPLGKKLRSKKEVQTYCEQNNLEANLDLFRFTRVSVSSASKGEKRKSLPALSRTPKIPKSPKIKNPKRKLVSDIGIKKDVKPMKKAGKKSISLNISGEEPIKKRLKNSVWSPPKSPFNLFQENLYEDPWKLLIGTLFLNKAAGDEKHPGSTLLWDFLERWKTPEEVMVLDCKDVAEFIKPMINNEKLAKTIVKFSEEYLAKMWNYPKELHGIGKYGNDSYRIFCANEWRKVKPTDPLLRFYVSWLWDNSTFLGLDESCSL